MVDRGPYSMPGIPRWLATVASIAVLYPAAMSAWFWFGAMVWGPVTITTNRCIQWGFGRSGGVNCYGEGWAETGFMVAGVVLGLLAMAIIVYAQSYKVGLWIYARPMFKGGPVDRVLPKEFVVLVSMIPAFLITYGGWLAYASAFLPDINGQASRFEGVFLGSMVVAVATLVWVGVYRGTGYRWRIRPAGFCPKWSEGG